MDELHPAVALAAFVVGPIAGPLIGAAGKFTAGLVVAVYLKRWALHTLLPASILSLWAAWYNVWGAEVYYPNLMRIIPW
jgi:uncharacterized membrane protein